MAAFLILAEVILITVSVDTQYFAEGGLSWLIKHMGELIRWIIITSAVFALLLYFSRSELNNTGLKLAPFSLLNLTLHIIAYVSFYVTTQWLFNGPIEQSSWGMITLISGLWLILGALTFFFWLKFLLDIEPLKRFLIDQKKRLLYSSLMAAAILVINIFVYGYWQPPSIISFTLYGTDWLLRLIGQDVFIDAEEYFLGINDFIVHISVECSGIEGLIIALSSTAVYLFFMRTTLSFPKALLLLPIAALVSVIFNVIRIAALIFIGAYFSPEIAVGGFHSVAGWIAAIFVAALIIFGFSSFSFFNKISQTDEKEVPPEPVETGDSNLARAMLIPFIVFLFCTLVLQIFVADFDFLYPLKAIAGAIALAACWKHYQFKWPIKWLEPILAGLVIAILWILLVPENNDYNAFFTEIISEFPLWMVATWFVFRLAGAWIIIPLIEEMIFRGYLLARLAGQELSNQSKPDFSWVAIIISSVLFAFIHNAIIAGFVAGIIFAIVRYRSNSLSEAVLAHTSANVLVSLWAISTGQWVLM